MTTSLYSWEETNRAELVQGYAEYLRHALEDSGFDVTTTEDYWRWVGSEYELERDHEQAGYPLQYAA